MAYNHGMEENWRPHHVSPPRNTMDLPKSRCKENGVKGSDITNDVLASPGQNDHVGQVTFDRHQETVPKLEEEGFYILHRFLGFGEESVYHDTETSGRRRYGYQSLETPGMSSCSSLGFEDTRKYKSFPLYEKASTNKSIETSGLGGYSFSGLENASIYRSNETSGSEYSFSGFESSSIYRSKETSGIASKYRSKETSGSEFSFSGFESSSIYRSKETSGIASEYRSKETSGSEYSFSGFESASIYRSKETSGSEFSFSGFENASIYRSKETSENDSAALGRVNRIGTKKWKTSKKWKIATWNVRTMYQVGKKANVEKEMRRLHLDILGISEVRWPGVGCVRNPTGEVFIYSGGKNAERGVGVMLSRYINEHLIGFWAVSDRVLLVKIRGAPFDVCIIQVYAPTSEHDEEEVDKFYEEVNLAREQCKEHECIMVIGDFNAKVGQGKVEDIVGPHGLGKRNDRGDKLVNWCSEKRQAVMNTWFSHHPRHLWTWKSPGDRSRNQIDYITINKRFRNSITQVKTFPGTDCNSDHVPVVATVRIKLKNVKRNVRKPVRQLQKLRIEEIKNQYNEIVRNRYDQLSVVMEENYAYDKWNNLEKAIKEGNDILPKRERKALSPWMTEEILDMMEERRKKKRNEDEYHSLNKRIHKECIKAKEKWMDEKCCEIEDLDRLNQQQLMYERVKEVTGKKIMDKSNSIKNDDGKVLMEAEDVKERWTEYIGELFDDDRPEHLEVRNNEEGPPILRAEVENAFEKMKRGRATADDGIAVEMLAALEDYGMDVITEIASEIYESGEIGPQMYKSIFIPIPKIPGTLECNNHRTISIMNQITKIVLKVILNRLRNKILPEISNEQCGFIKGKGTRNAIFILRMLTERAIEVNKDLYICFVDFEKAFDRVKHENLMKMLEDLNVDGKDLRLVKNLYWKQEATVRVCNGETRLQEIRRGVRQGCVMSPDFFNLYAEIIMRKLIDLEGIKVGGVNVNNLRYADDTALIADSKEKLQNLIDALDKEGKENGLNINIKKTKVMVVTKDHEPPKIDMNINNQVIEQVDHFNYLGSLVTFEGRCDEEIRRRIILSKYAYNKNKNLLTNSKISIELRKRFLKCYVWSVLLYGCESWTMGKEEELRILALEMWLYRRMLKIPWTAKKTNEEVLAMAKAEREIISNIQQRQMRFLGHILRRDGLEKLVVEGKLDGRKSRGRPRRSYIQNLKNCTTCESKGGFIQAAQHRNQWRNMVVNVQ